MPNHDPRQSEVLGESPSKHQDETKPSARQEFHLYKLLGVIGIVTGSLALVAYILQVYYLGVG